MACRECESDVRDVERTDEVDEDVSVVQDVSVVEVYDISLQEAARLYDVSLATLRKRVRWGEIFAYKTRGPWGDEWRVSGPALEAQGYRRREAVAAGEMSPEQRVVDLERELGSVRRMVQVEKARADQADGELGQAMLEIGRLRAALAQLRGEESASTEGPIGG